MSLSWAALSKMLTNISGQAISYDSFKSEYDANPAFASLVSRFDSRGIILKTHEEQSTAVSSTDATSTNDQMAKAASKKMISR